MTLFNSQLFIRRTSKRMPNFALLALAQSSFDSHSHDTPKAGRPGGHSCAATIESPAAHRFEKHLLSTLPPKQYLPSADANEAIHGLPAQLWRTTPAPFQPSESSPLFSF